MNIIDFFKKVVDQFNETERCGLCWEFKAPLNEAGMNKTQLTADTKCCVQLFITDYKTEAGYRYNGQTELQNAEWCDHTFTLYVVQPTNIGLNTYNEIPGHPIQESLWETILKPLQDCLGCGAEIDLCALGYEFDIMRWSMNVVQLKEDANYVGWKIFGVFRQKKAIF